MMSNKFISEKMAKKLIDFSGGKDELKKLGQLQLEGAVALYNRIQQNGIAYLADEVGMGKTYMGLGVVALMRYFQPSLRVLFILPKQNILNKWYETDYSSFLRENFKVSNYRVKDENHQPIAQQAVCSNLRELIEMSTTGYYGDFFIKMSSFSFGLSDDGLKGKLEDLHELVPAYPVPDDSELDKDKVKKEYADTINRILPWFDLVVVDEAHNFRKGPEVSYRNQVLSRILGTWPHGEGVRKVGKVLLLSATPFEYGLDELKKQMQVFGYGDLIQNTNLSKKERNKVLNKFMVRRINHLEIMRKEYTRNMYRCEHRSDAAITLDDKDYKTKLVTALVQKKVGELVRGMRGQYQTGMLASFESYIPSSTRLEVEFDGDQEERGEAKDTSLIRHLVDSYREATDEQTLPHPKMDKIVEQYSDEAFEQGRKQIIFVRRIKSVDDLKEKFDTQYDRWLYRYLEKEISNPVANERILEIFDDFQRRKGDIDTEINIEADTDDIDKLEAVPANNNFFTYFFRGKFEDETDGFIKPLSFRKLLTRKRNDELGKIAQLFDVDGKFFAQLLQLLEGEPDEKEFYRELLFSHLRLGHGFIDLYIAYLNGGSKDFLNNFMDMLYRQKEQGEFFSTYQQLKDLKENFPLIIKTNFSDYRNAIDIRRYIQYRLSPLEPVSGAMGGDDKSAIARKFRMPGYPMILISTNVLQEGEDLHTFCDTVVHYGLSASPIAIEQKTGRVDRVGALAHRRLLKCKDPKLVSKKGIQVYFPFLKESIEAIQVREVARRLNAFLESLHEFESHISSTDKLSEDLLQDKSEIPPLKKELLRSPFEITQEDLEPKGQLERLNIKSDRKNIKRIKKHINTLMKDFRKQIEYKLTSGSTPHTFILKISPSKNIEQGELCTLSQLKKKKCDHNTHVRTYIASWKNDEQILSKHDVHLYVGDESITQPEEIEDAVLRLKGQRKKLDRNFNIHDITKLFDGEFLHTATFLRNHTLEADMQNNRITFQFSSGEHTFRKQVVTIESKDGYLLFKSNALNLNDIDWQKTKEDKGLFIINHTFLRNAFIDFVDFYLDDNWIRGRIVYPVWNLQNEEFMYYAYILACEADRLEHVVNDFYKGDRY